MDINISTKSNYKIDNQHFQKMLFIFNAVNDGWSVKKNKDSYIFLKDHEGKSEIFSESYLQTFITSNLNYDKLLQ
jgi:hypothetical protein